MKKFLLTLFAIIFTTQITYASDKIFDKATSLTGIKKGSVSISVKDIYSGETVKEYNSDVPVSPASTQKILTYFASRKILGNDYNFTTKLYAAKNGDYYIVLGADPYLTSKDLKVLISHIPHKKGDVLKKFYIDDSILDNNTAGEGWQWDDSLNVLMPKFGAYNIDKNIYSVIVKPTTISNPADIFTEIFYPTPFINKTITTLNINNVKITKEENDISPDALTVSGEVDKTVKIKIPVNHLRRYFILRLDDAFRDNKISYMGKYERAKLPANSKLIAEIKHPSSLAATDILKNSNNLVAETYFKLAGAKYTKTTGTQAGALAMFNNFCTTSGLDCSGIRLTDGSGVSKNNLVTADFMTQYLVKMYGLYNYDTLKSLLPTSGEGTLTNRMPMLKDKIHAKTGTLSNISGIIGYIDTKKNKTYAFAIYINDGKSSESSKKLFEEIVLREIFNKM